MTPNNGGHVMLNHSVIQSRSFKAAPSPTETANLGDTIAIMGAVMNFRRNEEIYGEGEKAEFLYKVASGTVRTYKVLDDGRRQIGAFYVAGDVFGLEDGEMHGFSAEAVTDSKVHVARRSALIALAGRDTEVARQLWTITSRELQRAQNHFLALIKTAEERVASFLLDMAARLTRDNQFDLTMSRQDIADYLGLTIETVSRTMTQLESSGAIALPTSRRVVLRNRAALSHRS
jgi:CRP/FNR family nitrogen fixation transcriptional regulator